MSGSTRANAVDLVVIGPPKSGTSSLFAALEAHPGVDTAHAKEPVFFSTDRGLDLGAPDGPARSGGYGRGMSWYEDLFRGSVDAVRLEGSTDYFASPTSPGLLATHAPGAHLVVCLREPAERLVSQYWHERRFADLPGLEQLTEHDHPRLSYWRQCSRYGAALERWLEHHDPTRIHLVSFDAIRDDVTIPASRILEAVGLDAPDDAPLTGDTSQRNAAGTSRSRRLHRLLTVSRTRRAAERLPDWVQRPLRDVARRAMNANLDRSGYPDTDPAVLSLLRSSFGEDRVLLRELCERHWPDVLAEVDAWPT